MPEYTYDLHIHSCLSPCGDNDMTPGNIVGMAYIKGLQVIALTDHNTCKNCPAIIKHGQDFGITVIPGMELTTAEEVHVVCLFDDLANALAFDTYVEQHLMKIKNKPTIFGNQYLIDENDQICDEYPYLLINATTISFDEVADLMEQFHGIMIPAHIDKNSNSLISNLGFIPPDSRFQCAEIFRPEKKDVVIKQHPYLAKCHILHNSDAHNLADINEPVHSITAASTEIKQILAAINSC